jgi:hypothetical protein
MDAQTRALPAETDRIAAAPRALLAIFVLAIFVSAALLFVVEPMFTKMVLPRLGGAASVWSVAVAFFQTALLAGYAYAHLLTRFAPGRASILIHLAVLVAAAFTLPLAIAAGWSRPPAEGAALWLVGLFAVSIGLPFFALAANGPLLQAWFSRTDHPAARDPYFLYVASNAGSLLALLSYPALVEPFVPLGAQSRLWSIGFYVLILLVALSGVLARRQPGKPADAPLAEAAPPSWRDGLVWCALAAVPSGYLVAVTAYLSIDVAAVPLLWVLPLALYLLSLMVVFQRRPLIPHALAVNIQPLLILALIAVLVFDPVRGILELVALNGVAFFVGALVCHGELARRRPAPSHLTAFYLWMAAGGMVGGIAAALLAPVLFNWVAEYPIAIALAILCRPGFTRPAGRRGVALIVATLVLAAATMIYFDVAPPDITATTFNWIVGGFMIVSLLFWRTPIPLAAAIATVLHINHIYADVKDTTALRSFYGVHRISETFDGRFRILSNGTTLHGAEHIRGTIREPVHGRPDLLMYYYDGSAMAQVMDVVRARRQGPIRYAVVGLGAGTLACRAGPADTVHYYEIDPVIVRIARDSSLFHYLEECRPDVPIMLGDARLTLADAPDGAYDIIYVDAFSSDAIPIHLLTREAMSLYLAKLAPGGMVAVHVSNRYLELASVVAGIAAAKGAHARVNDGSDVQEMPDEYLYVGTVVAVARTEEDFGALAQSPYWPERAVDPAQWVWTDDYSNMLGALIRQIRGQ